MVPPQNEGEFRRLLSKLSDGAATPEEAAWLKTALRDQPRWRYLYLEFMVMEGALRSRVHRAAAQEEAVADRLVDWRRVFSSEPTASEPPGEERETLRTPIARAARAIDWRFHPVRFFAFAASLTLLMWGAWASVALWKPVDQVVARSSSAPATMVARLVHTSDARWKEEIDAPFEGAYLRTGQVLRLEQGLAELEFKLGTRVILEGPVEFQLVAPDLGRLKSGRLCALVPPHAAGFAVETPLARVVDFGTEFGVEAAPNEPLHVHVFQGAVEVTWNEGEQLRSQRLLAGEALRLDQQRTIATSRKATEAQFVRRLPPGRVNPVESYRREVLASQPVAYWSLGSPGLAVGEDFVGQHFARWHGDSSSARSREQGAKFDGWRNYLEVATQPTLRSPSFTLSAWIRFSALREEHQSIITARTDQVGAGGNWGYAFYLGLQGECELFLGDGSRDTWQELRGGRPVAGQWAHVVAQFAAQELGPTRAQGEARIYLDGALVAQSPHTYAPDLSGILRVGAGSRQGGLGYYYGGEIAHLAIYDRALDAAAIAQLHQQGLPTFAADQAE